jgi:integrase
MGARTSWRRVRVERGIYLLPNRKYAVCCRRAGRLWYRTVGPDLGAARSQRQALIAAAEAGVAPAAPRLRFDTVAGWWLERFAAKVAAGERHPRTLEAHRYQLDRHLLPALGPRRIASITVDDVAELLDRLRGKGCSPKTSASAVATLQSVMRFARRRGWIVADPVERLEHDERPRPERRRQRVLGRPEIERLLALCSPRDRLMVATVLYTGLRISEMLGLVWDDVDFAAGVIHVRAQLSRAHRTAPARRVPPKTAASVRDIPLVVQLARLLAAHRQASPFPRKADWVFATSRGTPYGHRNVSRRVLARAAQRAGLNDASWPPLRFHDLRHTFASHLIVDVGLDVAQVSRILGHARITITLDTYTHLFEDARHAHDIRTRMATSAYAGLLERNRSDGKVVPLR